MFEQSLLINHPTNKSWSVLASLTGEIMLIGLALLIPLLFTQQLPQFHLSDLSIRPPAPAPPKPVDVVRSSSTTSSTTLTQARPFVRPDFSRAGQNPVSLVDDLTSPLPPAALATGTDRMSPMLTDFASRIPIQPPHTPPAATAPSGPVRVTSSVQLAKLVKQVIPVYPPMAKLAGVSGTVQLLGTISKDGTIRNLQVISGNPLLVGAAVDAVQQWIYRPTLLSGEPVEVIAPIEVRFILNR
jgi:periplasmic protein TonB